LFSDFLMKSKKDKTKSTKTGKKSAKKKAKKSANSTDDSGIVLIDDIWKLMQKRKWKSVKHFWKKHAHKILLTRLNLYSF